MSPRLDHDLAALADSAERQSSLPSAATLRRRGDRRRAVPVVAASVAAVVAVVWGSATVLPGLGPDADRAATTPTASPTASPTTSPDPGTPLATPADSPEVFRGERLVAVMTVDGSRVLRVDRAADVGAEDGAAVVASPDLDTLAQWRPTPVTPGSDEVLLAAASVPDPNLAPCLQVEGGVATIEPCDTRVAGQVLHLEPASDVDGHPSYALVTAAGERLSVGGERYLLVDRGPVDQDGD